MAKIKFSKTELKRQRDLHKQFTRFLPTLQLKKQQLQMEVMRALDELTRHEAAAKAYAAKLDEWVGLLQRDEFAAVAAGVAVAHVRLQSRNIAGVEVPVLAGVDFTRAALDLFATPYWADAAAAAVEERVTQDVKTLVLREQASRLQDELRTTTQRVNLFEKVKIPECEENIRVIQIYLGDQQTAAVGRSKIAKGKLVAAEAVGA